MNGGSSMRPSLGFHKQMEGGRQKCLQFNESACIIKIYFTLIPFCSYDPVASACAVHASAVPIYLSV